MHKYPPLIGLLWYVAVLIGSAAARAQEPSISPPRDLRRPQTNVNGPPLRPIYVPNAMTSADIDRYARWLALSEEQTAVLRRACTEYESDWEGIRNDDIPGLLQIAERAAAADPPTPANIGQIEALVRENGRIRERLFAVDESLFGKLEQVLAEPQLSAMTRVRLDRLRSRSTIVGLLIPAASIDLTRLFAPHQAEITAESSDDFNAILVEYEQAVTPLMTRLADVTIEQSLKVARIDVNRSHDDNGQALDFQSDEAKKRNAVGRLERSRVIADAGDLQHQIADVNSAYMLRLIQHVQVTSQASVLAEYRRRAFPAVFPDPLDPAAVVQSIRESKTLAEHERALVDAHWERYTAEYAATTNKMVERFSEWRRRFACTQSLVADAYVAYRADMRKWRDERWLANAQIVSTIMSSINATTQAEVEERVGAFMNNVRALQLRAAKDEYPGP